MTPGVQVGSRDGRFDRGAVVAFLLKYGVSIAFVALIAFFAFATNGVFTQRENLLNLSRQATMIGIISMGMTIVMISGGIDLSVGGIVGAVGIVVALLQVDHGWSVWASIAGGLVLGLVLGLWNGVFVSRFGIAPFIVTLGMMSIARGIALVLSEGASIVPRDPAFAKIASRNISNTVSIVLIVLLAVALGGSYLARGLRGHSGVSGALVAKLLLVFVLMAVALHIVRDAGIPLQVAIWALIAVASGFILRRTRFGRNVYAVGGNESAAWLSAVDVRNVKLTVYAISGLLAAVSAIILTSRQAAAVPQQGSLYELDAIAAVVIGGTGLNGGYGTITGTLVGVGIVASTNNGLSLMNIDPLWQYIVKGLIITFAVLLDRRR
ncbi:MAG: hypothetical protein IT335_05085 [Thermomicrobiales bacterium]|nr:hypothetical protein [Thermomicrobiales bacterium]